MVASSWGSQMGMQKNNMNPINELEWIDLLFNSYHNVKNLDNDKNTKGNTNKIPIQHLQSDWSNKIMRLNTFVLC